jgi:hypothetical protein
MAGRVYVLRNGKPVDAVYDGGAFCFEALDQLAMRPIDVGAEFFNTLVKRLEVDCYEGWCRCMVDGKTIVFPIKNHDWHNLRAAYDREIGRNNVFVMFKARGDCTTTSTFLKD